MRTDSPWLPSAGETTRASTVSVTRPARVMPPSTLVAGVAVVRDVGVASCSLIELLVSLVDQVAEGDGAPGAEHGGEHGDQSDPGPAIRHLSLDAERRFDCSRCSD